MNARMKSGASFTWQSILAGVQTFNRGCIWRVGDGSQIKIWEDCWIPNSQSGKVITARGNLLTMVSDLIDPRTGGRDEQLVRDTFLASDASRILAIPLSLNGMEDFVAWKFTKNGLFSVRSAYHVQWNHQSGAQENLSRPGGSIALRTWKTMWACDVAAKIKTFAWKTLLGVLPCYGVLANRHIITSSQCP